MNGDNGKTICLDKRLSDFNPSYSANPRQLSSSSNWQTYYGEDYTIQHPPGWDISQGRYDGFTTVTDISPSEPIDKYGNRADLRIEIPASEVSPGSNIEKAQKYNWVKGSMTQGQININRRTADYIEGTINNSSPQYSAIYELTDRDAGISGLTINIDLSATNEDPNILILKQILLTFSFNPKLDNVFNFSLPNGWKITLDNSESIDIDSPDAQYNAGPFLIEGASINVRRDPFLVTPSEQPNTIIKEDLVGVMDPYHTQNDNILEKDVISAKIDGLDGFKNTTGPYLE